MHYYEVKDTAALLTAWAAGDFDGFADSLKAIVTPGEDLIDMLEDADGDARAIQDGITEQLRSLAEMAQAALYMVRKAVELVLDPPGERFSSRQEVLDHLLPTHPEAPAPSELTTN